MRTNLTLDSKLIDEVKRYTGCSTNSKAMTYVIEDFLRWKRVEKVKNHKGKIQFRQDTATVRKKAR